MRSLLVPYYDNPQEGRHLVSLHSDRTTASNHQPWGGTHTHTFRPFQYINKLSSTIYISISSYSIRGRQIQSPNKQRGVRRSSITCHAKIEKHNVFITLSMREMVLNAKATIFYTWQKYFYFTYRTQPNSCCIDLCIKLPGLQTQCKLINLSTFVLKFIWFNVII